MLNRLAQSTHHSPSYLLASNNNGREEKEGIFWIGLCGYYLIIKQITSKLLFFKISVGKAQEFFNVSESREEDQQIYRAGHT